MSEIIKSDIVDNGVARLLPQFSTSTRIKGLLQGLLSGAQPTEDVLFEVMQSTNLDTAEGVQLDTLGKLLNEYRGSDSDDVFRQRIYFKISVNTAKGTPYSMKSLINFATGALSTTYTEYFPAEAHLVTTGGAVPPIGFLDLVSPVGVGTYLSNVISTDTGWLVSEEGAESILSVLPEEGDEAGFMIAEEIN